MKKKAVDFRFGLDEPPDWVKKELEPLPIPTDEKDAEFWAKGGAHAILGSKAMGKLKKKFYSTPPSNSEISRMWKDALRNK